MKLPPIVLVTGTDTGVGKTITTAAVTAALHQRGRTVAVYKPCQSGNVVGDSDCAEVTRLADPLTTEAGVVLQEPMAPVPAAVLDEVTLPLLDVHAGRIRELSAAHDHVLVEGAGGLLVELDHDGGTLADLGTRLGDSAAFVVVARSALGTLNHTALTLEALDRRTLPVVGVVLGSWPVTPGAVERSNRAAITSWPVPFLGAIPVDASGLDPADFRAHSCAWLEGLPA
ncbi:dethiobiotin synthase [Arthrobacter sp. AK01]|uniref:dethiobiotin synthase n=1 Tax=Micrococcaceae TaxID=1268 RepID=UPI001E388FF0|nr:MULTISPECIES: dethiobiotin synthase [Micrococcaceae]MCD4852177.1 dethiobiotin synthase [Arthrobacter sp. AK01]MCP1412819.1 8-amino-7-oxononanoate synthase/dethiobiotin synthetase [Paenarthrobacter sp. A20]